MDGFTEIAKLADKLSKNIDRNTKKEIKDLSIQLTRKTAELNQIEMWDWLEEIVDNSIETWSHPCPLTEKTGPATVTDQCTQTEPDGNGNIKIPNKRDTETQTEDDTMKAARLRQQIHEDLTPQNLEDLLSERWPEEVYLKTRLKEGHPLDANDRDTDQIIFVQDGEKDMNKGVYKAYADRFPELVDMTEENSMNYITQTVKTFKGETEVTTETSIYRINIDNANTMSLLSVLSVMNKAALRISENRRTKVAMPRITNVEESKLRKIIEIAFRNFNGIVDLYIRKARRQQNPRTERSKRSGNDAILIRRTEGQTYADLLKNIKDEIITLKTDAKITKIKETRKGDAIVTLEKNDKHLNVLSQSIKRRFGQQVYVKPDEKQVILHVRDIDAIATKQDIEDAVKTTLTENDLMCAENSYVTNVRPTYGTCQMATVRVPESAAKALTRKGRIRIGVTYCRIERRKEHPRCFKCWGLDHLALSCTGPDRTGLCSNCAQPNHQAKTCKNNSFCPICNVEGHRATTMRCPIYRKAANKEQS